MPRGVDRAIRVAEKHGQQLKRKLNGLTGLPSSVSESMHCLVTDLRPAIEQRLREGSPDDKVTAKVKDKKVDIDIYAPKTERVNCLVSANNFGLKRATDRWEEIDLRGFAGEVAHDLLTKEGREFTTYDRLQKAHKLRDGTRVPVGSWVVNVVFFARQPAQTASVPPSEVEPERSSFLLLPAEPGAAFVEKPISNALGRRLAKSCR
jgi:hypothetical protein